MEAATPLRKAHVRTLGESVVVDGLTIDDPAAVALVRTRENAGEDPATVVADAIEIGARVMDREQTGADVDLIKSELGNVSREAEAAFTERANEIGDRLAEQLEAVFGADSGALSKALQRHFSDDSSQAVQNRVRDMVRDLMTQAQRDLVRQFSSADDQNPLADFKQSSLEIMRQASERQDKGLEKMSEKLAAMELEVQRLHAEREKQLELADERERGTAKGRTYEESVAAAIDAIALGQGDDSDAVGDLKGATGKTGDVVVSIDACNGPARGRIVFEAKDSKLSKPEALRQLDRAREERAAQYAVLVVPTEEELPARTRQLREVNGDKLFVVHDPEDGSRLALEVAYTLARARVLAARSEDDGLDAGALSETVERALTEMDNVRKVKQQLTGATTNIENAREVLDSMADVVRTHLRDIEAVLAASQAVDRPAPADD